MIRSVALFIIISASLIFYYVNYVKSTPGGDDLEKRIEVLENALVATRASLADLPQPSIKPNDFEERIKVLEKDVAQLKKQPAQTIQVASKSPLYIPLGSGGTAGDKGWYSMPGYEISVDPADYAGYSGMQLEVNFRMTEVAGVGMARLYNQTDNQSIGSEITIASDNMSLQTTSSFKLPAGKKIYRLQIKSTYGANLEIQSARIRVSF